jgi:molybdate transport system substrate-binding protein
MVLGALALAGCGGSTDTRPVALIASSLRPALEGAYPGLRTSFESSGAIAAKVRQGAQADVVLVADPAIAEDLEREGLIDAPVTIAGNGLAVLVPNGNPQSITTLGQLAEPGRRVVIAAERVPLGAYTRKALISARAEGVLDNVVTEEPEAAGVVAKVTQGEVDAGIGYVSDLSSGRVAGFALARDAQVQVRYDVGVVKTSTRTEAARVYVVWLRGPDGRAALTQAGFTVP